MGIGTILFRGLEGMHPSPHTHTRRKKYNHSPLIFPPIDTARAVFDQPALQSLVRVSQPIADLISYATSKAGSELLC
jgi:hypothetical protein